jgi:hypothetical protein
MQKSGNDFTSCIQHILDPWNPYVPGMDIEGRKAELLKLHKYLQYLVQKSKYDVEKIFVESALKRRCKAIV